MWLPWWYAAFGAVVLASGARWVPGFRGRTTWAEFAREASIIAALYALWLRAGQFDPFGTAGGMTRGRQVWQIEKLLLLDHEAWVQSLVIGNRLVVQASNLYYAGVHVPAMGVFLLWLFIRHRAELVLWRTTLALTTAVCLVGRYVPVAPPRFYPEYGFVDTAVVYGQSVYGPVGTGASGQFAAMPSVHVAWAVLIGVAVWRISPSRWRWIGPAHAVLTMISVTDTANHWILDGVVGAAVLVPAYAAARRWNSRNLTEPAPVSQDGHGDGESDDTGPHHRLLGSDHVGDQA